MKPAAPDNVIARSSVPPCGMIQPHSALLFPFAVIHPATAPNWTPLKTSRNAVPMPAVRPKANASSVTWILFVRMVEATRGRARLGIS